MLILLLVTALAAAARGLWSPCGLSMLSSLNPLSERARGHRFGLTAAWYLAGAAVGGALLGIGFAAGAAAVARLHLAGTLTWATVAVCAAVAVASDLRLGGWSLPVHPRQVDERWLTTYRRWIYAGGYGVQIGTGFATYIMSAAMYLLAALALLGGSPTQAFAAGLVFGAARGLGIALTVTARDPDRLRSLLARIDAWAGPSIRLACAVEVGVVGAAIWSVAGPLVAGAVAVALGAAVLVGVRGGRAVAIRS